MIQSVLILKVVDTRGKQSTVCVTIENEKVPMLLLLYSVCENHGYINVLCHCFFTSK